MRVAVWGAGNLGSPLVRRLTMSPHISEVRWINRSRERIAGDAIDIEHGLAFAPTCHWFDWQPETAAEAVLGESDVVVLTAGQGVPPGDQRAAQYHDNQRFYRDKVLGSLDGFAGIVLVVTNPVDLMARLVYQEGLGDDRRVLGLGTLVETGRLRVALADHLRPARTPRDIWAFAIGLHDPSFLPVAQREVLCPATTAEDFDDALRQARGEVAWAADRVKQGGGATVHPIVEGIVTVLQAIATDGHDLMTVSARDPETPDNLFYSVPCIIGRQGVITRCADLCPASDLAACRAHASDLLRSISPPG
jgi:L-lactate dehydrogenase